MTAEEKRNEEKVQLFLNNMATGVDAVVTTYKNMVIGAEEALEVIEDPQVQDAIVVIATRCCIAAERIKERTKENVDELKARRPKTFKTPEKEEETEDKE
jgi:ribose 1,5-bisphosphokinase PhnN